MIIMRNIFKDLLISWNPLGKTNVMNFGHLLKTDYNLYFVPENA